MIRLRYAIAAALAAAACASGGQVRETARVIRSDVEKARSVGAERCAPRELAFADTNLEFSEEELALGREGRARRHLEIAEDNVKRALVFADACGASPEKEKPVVLVVAVEPRDEKRVVVKLDRDGDGIPDSEDACPDQPGPKETRGCPDSDGDGIPDHLDKCPTQFGSPPDGCPKKYSLVEIKADKIAIRQQVRFATAKAVVLPASFKLLDQVVKVLNDYPSMRVSVEGHTDDVGGEASNLRLSKKRAEAVREYLVSKGISPARLEAVGYGSTKPIALNKTAKGRAKNRRTEFKLVR